MRQKSITPKNILLAFLSIYLIVGVFIANDYGIGLDHNQILERAEVAMRRYTLHDTGDPVEEYLSLGVNQYYDTMMMGIFSTVRNAVAPILHVSKDAVLNFLIFLTFLMGIWAVFGLSRRWMNEWAALMAALLFGTQPLFFGHGFINPKDIPNMSMFLVTVLSGFRLADVIQQNTPTRPSLGEEFRAAVRQDWQSFSPKKQTFLRREMVIIPAAVIVLWVVKIPHWLIAGLIRIAYNSSETSWFGTIFRRFAVSADSVSLEDYLNYSRAQVERVFLPLLALVMLVIVILAVWLFHHTRKYLWHKATTWAPQMDRSNLRKISGAALLAGVVWGLAISTRVTGLAAGGIVGLYLLLRHREKSFLALVIYTLAAAATTYVTWPYLWYFGLGGLIGGLSTFANYPFIGNVWLRGIISTTEIPPTYLPHTMAVQFTEPLILLALVGIVLGVILAAKKKLNRVDIFILLCWYFLPVLYAAISRPTMYNNFRQFFFITPPLFIFAGLTMDWIGQKVRSKAVLAGLAALILVPGVIGMIRLHPYQYVYYNQFVGGTEGAAGLYELDYWDTSYRELVEYVNEHAPQNARILVRGGGDVTAYYARPDLQLTGIRLETTEEELDQYDYLIMSTNHRHQMLYLDLNALDNVFEVYAGDTLLSMVKKIHP